MISQSCEIDHSECHCGGGRHTVSQICQARSPDKNLGATDPRAPVNRDRWLSRAPQIFRRNTRFAGTVIRPDYQLLPRFGARF